MKRSAPIHQSHRKDRPKKAKLELPLSQVSSRFLNANDVRAALRSNEESALVQALTTLRNQLTVRYDEDALLPQDERLLLANSWLEMSPGAQDVFSIIGQIPKPSPKIISLCLAVLSALLNLLSTHFVYHRLGESIVKTFLTLSHIRQLNANLTETNTDLIISTLKLFNSMANFAGGIEKRAIMDGFSWGQKSLQKLLFLRGKGKGVRRGNVLAHPDVRTLYVYFILSFLSKTTQMPIKLSFLEQHRDVFLLLFKGISQDPYVVACHILEVCWEGIWGDPKIKRTLKIGLFNESTFNHLLKLYNRNEPEDGTTDHVPADLIHHFMLAVMTRPGEGICFKSRGWYPRDNSLEQNTQRNGNLDLGESVNSQGGKIYNKILANIVKNLKVNEDSRQQELAFKIVEACPELIPGYWVGANLTLEPRLSSRWITNISIIGTIISLPIPTSSFFLAHSAHHDPSPPPLSSITANVLPSVLSKAHLTKGLQSPSGLVQHCTTLALLKCLLKLNNTLSTFHDTSRKLEEVGETGQWSKRSRELTLEVEKRVPDFMVIMAMVQQKHGMGSREPPNHQAALLAESALRLLWLYHKLFPRLVSEVRFDVGKLLLGVFDPVAPLDPTDSSDMSTDDHLNQASQNGLVVLRQLHVLRLLKESAQFVWSNKSGASSRSHLHALFTLYTKTSHLAVRRATSELLIHLLSPSILFSHDPLELDLWLSALPSTRRGAHSTGPDGTLLTDESIGVLAFLDDCIQRCLKTPYRYLEDGHAFFKESMQLKTESFMQDDPSTSPSPLLMTVLDQLRAKCVASLLSSSDILAIATFTRKLVCALTTKMQDHIQRVCAVGSKIEEILSITVVAPDSIVMQNAIKRESDILSQSLRFIQDPHPRHPTSTSPAVQEFLTKVEALPIPSSEAAASSAACELVDWIRIIHPPLHHTEVHRLLGMVIRLSPSAVTEFLYQLDPQLVLLWPDSNDCIKTLEKYLPFEWAYLHSTPAQLTKTYIMDGLVSLFFSETAWNSSLERRISICVQRLAAGAGRSTVSIRHELTLLKSIMSRGRSRRDATDISRLKQCLFLESDPIKELCCSRDMSTADLAELSALIDLSLQSQTESDRKLALPYCDFWTAEAEANPSLRTCTLASPWIPFMTSTGIIKHLDIIIGIVQGDNMLDHADQRTVNVILHTLVLHSADPKVLTELQRRSRGLIAIRSSLHQKAPLDALLQEIVNTRLPLGCDSLPLILKRSSKISDVTLLAERRWNIRSDHLPLETTLVSTLLDLEDWDETIAKILSGSIYTSATSRRYFWAWLLKMEPSQAPLLTHVVVPLHACLDVKSLQNEDELSQFSDAWLLAIIRSLFHPETSDDKRTLCASCIWLLFQQFPSSREHCVTFLSKEIQYGNATSLKAPWMRLLRDLHQFDSGALSSVLLQATDSTLKWMVHKFSEVELHEDDIAVLEEIPQLVSGVEIKAHLVEPVLKAAIQSCLHMPRVINSLLPIVSSAHLKPATVNRHLQSIVQHSQLYRVADPGLLSRQPTIRLLHTLFHIYPNNTCQPSHIAPLARLYGGTLSISDRLLFSIFNLYEKQRKESVATIFQNWSPTPSAPSSQNTMQTIISLDPSRVFRTCTAFPTRQQLDGSDYKTLSTADDGLYDPVFLTLLAAQLVMGQKLLSSMEWVQIFRSNIVSLVICVFTSIDENFRKVGMTTLAGVLIRVKEADFLERGQVLYILNVLRDLVPLPTSVPCAPRLSTCSAMLLAHALRATFYPSSFLYPIISRFLLQRPELDTTDVPMLYSLLYSSEDGEWAKERAWMVRFLGEAMHEGSARDWAVLRRRHTWDLVASMWQATRLEERSLRKGILELLANLSSNQHAISFLILRSSLLTWMEMQLQTRMANDGEYIAWAKILENIIITANENRTEKASRGEFSASLIRCLTLLLRSVTVSGIDTSDAMATRIGLLHLISRVALRIATKRLDHTTSLVELLKNASQVLQTFEHLLAWPDETPVPKFSGTVAMPTLPHRARVLFDGDVTPSDNRCTLQTWAEIVTNLWKVTMSIDGPNLAIDVGIWDTLTCRLLLLRASPWVPQSANEVNLNEWARRECLTCMLQADVTEENRMEVP